MSGFPVGDSAVMCCCDDVSNNGKEVVIVKQLDLYVSTFWQGELLCYGVEALDNGEWFAAMPHQLRRKEDEVPDFASEQDARECEKQLEKETPR